MPSAPRLQPLTTDLLPRATKALAVADPHLAAMLRADGLPPIWGRPPGFATLVRIILEQQVTLQSGAAAYRRLSEGVGRVTPRLVAGRTHRQLCRLGLTRQKARYCRELALAMVEGRLDLSSLASSPRARVERELTRMIGIGRWTSDIYLIMALRHPDIWPRGDVALYNVIRRTMRVDGPPEKLDALADAWAPWRSVAARILWHHYLCQRRRPSR